MGPGATPALGGSRMLDPKNDVVPSQQSRFDLWPGYSRRLQVVGAMLLSTLDVRVLTL
jgi:hypothetical protein